MQVGGAVAHVGDGERRRPVDELLRQHLHPFVRLLEEELDREFPRRSVPLWVNTSMWRSIVGFHVVEFTDKITAYPSKLNQLIELAAKELMGAAGAASQIQLVPIPVVDDPNDTGWGVWIEPGGDYWHFALAALCNDPSAGQPRPQHWPADTHLREWPQNR